MNQIIPIEKVSASDLFAGSKLDELLAAIEKAAKDGENDTSTEQGRKAIASRAYAVSRSKTTIDDAGKALVSGWKEQAKAVDAERKRARDYLDALRDEVRKPLSDYEAEQKRIEQEKVDAELRRLAEAEEAKRLEMERREAELKAREEAIAKAEAEAKAKADAERAERERIEREAAQKKEVEAAAERERLAAIEREKQAKLAAEKAAKEAAEKAERDKQEAVRLAEERVRQEAAAKEAAAAAKEAESRKAAENLEHRRSINNAAVKALVSEGISQDDAKTVVTLIAAGSIPQITINY